MEENEKLLEQAESLSKDIIHIEYIEKNYGKALNIELKCLEIYLKVYGKYHKKVLHQHESLFGIYAHLNNITQGLVHEKEAIEISEKIFGEEHMHTANLLSVFGQCTCCRGNIEEGIEYLKKGFAIIEKELGEEHKKTKRLKSLIERAEKGEEINWCKE